MRKGVARGHVTLFARVERRETDGGAHRRGALRRVRRADARAAGALRLGPTVDVGGDSATAERHRDRRTRKSTGTAAELVAIVERAVAALDQMRAGRGRAARDLSRGAPGDHRGRP